MFNPFTPNLLAGPSSRTLQVVTQAKLNGDQRVEFENVFFSNKIDDLEKINSIKTFYESSGAIDYLKNKVEQYSANAKNLINDLQIDSGLKLKLNNFSEKLLNREI